MHRETRSRRASASGLRSPRRDPRTIRHLASKHPGAPWRSPCRSDRAIGMRSGLSLQERNRCLLGDSWRLVARQVSPAHRPSSYKPAHRAGSLPIKRRGWDSNPRAALRRPTVFETSATVCHTARAGTAADHSPLRAKRQPPSFEPAAGARGSSLTAWAARPSARRPAFRRRRRPPGRSFPGGR